jgi:hypothetical protein
MIFAEILYRQLRWFFAVALIACCSAVKAEDMTNFICKWKAIRTEDNQNWRPFASGGDPGIVNINSKFLHYKPNNSFIRNSALPTEKTKVGVLHNYIELTQESTRNAATFSYSNNGQRYLLLIRPVMKDQLLAECQEI